MNVSTLSMRGKWTNTGAAVTCPEVSVKIRFTPAYLPDGAVAVVPSKPINCGPVHAIGRLPRAKLPAASDIAVWPVQPVVFPLPSLPRAVTVEIGRAACRERV